MAKTYTALGPEMIDRITHQSFDWRTIILSKKIIVNSFSRLSSPSFDVR